MVDVENVVAVPEENTVLIAPPSTLDWPMLLGRYILMAELFRTPIQQPDNSPSQVSHLSMRTRTTPHADQEISCETTRHRSATKSPVKVEKLI